MAFAVDQEPPHLVKTRSKVQKWVRDTRAATLCCGVSLPLPLILIVESPYSWYEQKKKKGAASAESGTSKDTSPKSYKLPVSLEEPGLREAGERGTGKAARIPGWNEFDGLIVAPSGHRRSPQRAGWAGNRNHRWAAAAGKYSCRLSPSSPDISTRALLLISVSCIVYLNVRIISDIPYHSAVPSLFRLQISNFLQTWQFPRGFFFFSLLILCIFEMQLQA